MPHKTFFFSGVPVRADGLPVGPSSTCIMIQAWKGPAAVRIADDEFAFVTFNGESVVTDLVGMLNYFLHPNAWPIRGQVFHNEAWATRAAD